MEFKEKLQILRTQRKLSQEELAAQLNISRQSVTKWENGQTFPDIQNLIQLSEIFKLPIDRLVKDNDTCNIQIFSEHQYAKQDIRMFLIRAKNSTYTTGNHLVLPTRPNSRDYCYSEGDYILVYAMNYYGQTLNSSFNTGFLKEALSLVAPEKPYRGPEFYQNGDYTYHCQADGDFDCFHGEERIYCKQEKVYLCRFHGGSIA